MMVKVTFRPWEEVIIHNATQYTLNELIHTHSVGTAAGALAHAINWAEGVVVIITGMRPSDDVVREQLQGTLHLLTVNWALMPEYRNIIKIKESNVRVPVLDSSSNVVMSAVAKALKASAQE